MKVLAFLQLVTIFLISCNQQSEENWYNKDHVENQLTNNYHTVEFEPKHEFDSFTYQFLMDSLYLITFVSEGENYAQFGYWQYNDNELIMNDVGFESKFNVHTLSDSKIVLDNKQGKLIARRITPDKLNKELLLGTWIDPKDSFPTNIKKEFDGGKFFVNPKITFSKDSVQAKIYELSFHKAKYQLGASKKVIIIESRNNYFLNPIFIINSISKDSLDLSFKDVTGFRYRKKFVRIKNDA